jgi:hypothetical protein
MEAAQFSFLEIFFFIDFLYSIFAVYPLLRSVQPRGSGICSQQSRQKIPSFDYIEILVTEA